MSFRSSFTIQSFECNMSSTSAMPSSLKCSNFTHAFIFFFRLKTGLFDSSFLGAKTDGLWTEGCLVVMVLLCRILAVFLPPDISLTVVSERTLGCVVLLPSLFSTISQCSEFVDLMWVAASLINGKSTPTPTPAPGFPVLRPLEVEGWQRPLLDGPESAARPPWTPSLWEGPCWKGWSNWRFFGEGPARPLWPPLAAWCCMPSYWADCNMQNQTGHHNYLSVKHHCVPECLCIIWGSWWKARVLQTALIIHSLRCLSHTHNSLFNQLDYLVVTDAWILIWSSTAGLRQKVPELGHWAQRFF